MDLALASLSFLLLNFLYFFHFFVHSAQDEPSNSTCRPLNCGNFRSIRFPFADSRSPMCGLLLIDCQDSLPKIRSKEGTVFDVKNISYSQRSFAIQDPLVTGHLQQGVCDPLSKLKIPTFDYLYSNSSNPSLRIISCKLGYRSNLLNLFKYYPRCNDLDLYLSRRRPSEDEIYEATQHNCSSVSYSVLETPTDSEWENFDLISAVAAGFALQWNWTTVTNCDACRKSGGRCVLDHARDFACESGDGLAKARKKKILIGASTGAGMLATLIMFFIILRWKSELKSMIYFCKKTKNLRNVENFLKNYSTQKPKRYSYSDIMKMTDFLRNKLGQGGYGIVFKGQLRDGWQVAVKILSESKGGGEDFINEVATIGRTDHVNVVSLVGFCSEGSKRALIYDYMPNGSLEKFIFAENPKLGALGWETTFQIALGIAHGLEYLHRGCNNRIVHFDIKPHNILLDQDFCPKISDFGLAKLFPNKQSVMLMTVARGTLGYIAPEVIYRNFGGVSHKSDVYSYGMLLLEMVGGRKNVDARVENISEIYFPEWIYNQIERRADLKLAELKTQTEDEMARKMIMVGLWCIQTKPSDRPSMNKVVEMLEGNLDGLQIPPKPYLFSRTHSESADYPFSSS